MMTIRVYNRDRCTQIREGARAVAELPSRSNRREADEFLHILGWRRRTPWETTDWGWQAKLRRIKP
jgi:hypothetical protein